MIYFDVMNIIKICHRIVRPMNQSEVNKNKPKNEELFITPDMEKQLSTYIPSSLSDHIETRFGVELEVCVKLSSECIKIPDDYNPTKVRPTFKDKFQFFFKSIIETSTSYDIIREKYGGFIVYDEYYGNIYYDMFDLYHHDGVCTTMKFKLIERMDDVIGEPYYKELLDEYKVPIFIEDGSIICGDSTSSRKKNGYIHDNLSFSFECITPILSIKGSVTRDKVCNELTPLLLFFGLENPNCFINNYSMGFHVNTSVFDIKEDKYSTVGSPPLFNIILKEYMKKEREIYAKVRTYRPLSNKNKNKYIAHYAQPLYQSFNQFKKENPSKRNNNIINTLISNEYKPETVLSYPVSFITQKMRALKKKSDALLEFRLFESRNDIKVLCDFTLIALDIVHKSLDLLYRQNKKGGKQKNRSIRQKLMYRRTMKKKNKPSKTR
jgi:hypothetical protein